MNFFSLDVPDASLIAANQALEGIGKLEASENPGYASRMSFLREDPRFYLVKRFKNITARLHYILDKVILRWYRVK